MGDHYRCAALHRSLERLLHDLLALLIQGRRRLVQYQNLRVLDKRSGDRDALLLASRQLRAFEAANLFEAWVQLAFLLLNLGLVNHFVKETLVLLFDTCSTVLPDVVLEVVIRVRV